METRANYTAIGFFTLIVIALALGFIYWLKRFDENGVRRPLLVEFQGTVSGLEAGGSVYFNGLKVGEVTSLHFEPSDPNKITVTTSVREDTPIKTDTYAKISSSLLTGVAYIELSGGSPAAANVFSLNPPLLIAASGGGDIIASLNQISIKVDRIADRVDKVLADNQDAITQIVGNVRDFSKALAANSDGVKDFLKNVSDMSGTIKSLSTKLTGLVDKADTLIASVDPAQVKSMLANADSAVKRINDAAADAPGVVADVKQVVGDLKGFVGTFDKEKIQAAIDNVTSFTQRMKDAGPDIDQVIADAKATAKSANQFMDNINKHNGDVDQIVADAKSLAAQLKKSSGQLDDILGKTKDMLGTEGGKGFFAEATEAVRSIKAVADKFNAHSDEIIAGLSKFSGRGLDDVQALVDQMRGTVSRIDSAVSDFSRNPSSVVFGGKPPIRDYNRK
jgi:phospholipid/cholesterol/gamma-HCH transport system substrate-binding protein